MFGTARRIRWFAPSHDGIRVPCSTLPTAANSDGLILRLSDDSLRNQPLWRGRWLRVRHFSFVHRKHAFRLIGDELHPRLCGRLPIVPNTSAILPLSSRAT